MTALLRPPRWSRLPAALLIVRGIEPGGVSPLGGVLILVVWLYGTLVLADRRSGYVIILLGSIGGSAVPVLHMMGAGLVGGRIANSSGVFFWVWTLIALGVTAGTPNAIPTLTATVHAFLGRRQAACAERPCAATRGASVWPGGTRRARRICRA